MSTEPHPAACPYCGGKIVCQFQPDYLVRPVILADDGTITVGEAGDNTGQDFRGPALLFCYGCNSTYAQPGEVAELFDAELEVIYPDDVPAPGDPRYQGMGVSWTPLPVGTGGLIIAVAGGEDGR